MTQPIILGDWKIEHQIDPVTGLCNVKVISTKDAALSFTHPPQAIVRGITTRHDCHEQRWRQLNEKIVYRESDVIVASYPKCGTTWVEQLCLLLQNDGELSKLVGALNKNSFSPSSSARPTPPSKRSLFSTSSGASLCPCYLRPSSLPLVAAQPTTWGTP